MSNPEEQQAALIPRNFMERGTFMGGMFKIRNAIEGAVLAAGIGIPVVHLPLSLTTRIIILCMTSLPAAMVALIGIGGESLTAFLMNALRFVKNRRIIYRSDVMPDYRKRRQHAGAREDILHPSLPGMSLSKFRNRLFRREKQIFLFGSVPCAGRGRETMDFIA